MLRIVCPVGGVNHKRFKYVAKADHEVIISERGTLIKDLGRAQYSNLPMPDESQIKAGKQTTIAFCAICSSECFVFSGITGDHDALASLPENLRKEAVDPPRIMKNEAKLKKLKSKPNTAYGVVTITGGTGGGTWAINNNDAVVVEPAPIPEPANVEIPPPTN